MMRTQPRIFHNFQVTRRRNDGERSFSVLFMCGTGGLTLLEMLAVILIISIMLAVAIPTLNSFSKNAMLFSAARNIASQMRLARQLAITYRAVYGAWVDITADQVGVYYLGDDDAFDGAGANADVLYRKVYYTPALIDITDVTGEDTGTDGRVGIIFRTDGTADFDGVAGPAYVHMLRRGELLSSGSAYNPGGAYGAASNEDRVKCTSVMVRDSTGFPRTYRYGIGSPWSNNEM